MLKVFQAVDFLEPVEAVFRGMNHFFLDFQPEGSILDDRPPLEKLVALQHITDAALAF